jgi:hypothetical protein
MKSHHPPRFVNVLRDIKEIESYFGPDFGYGDAEVRADLSEDDWQDLRRKQASIEKERNVKLHINQEAGTIGVERTNPPGNEELTLDPTL